MVRIRHKPLRTVPVRYVQFVHLVKREKRNDTGIKISKHFKFRNVAFNVRMIMYYGHEIFKNKLSVSVVILYVSNYVLISSHHEGVDLIVNNYNYFSTDEN